MKVESLQIKRYGGRIMVKVIFSNHKKVLNWFQKDENYFRGWGFYGETYYQNENVIDLFDFISNYGFAKIIDGFNGNYSIIYKNDDKTFVAVDRIRSFPLFYFKYYS